MKSGLRLRDVRDPRDLAVGNVVVWMEKGHPDGSPLKIVGKTKYGEWLAVKLKPDVEGEKPGFEYVLPNVQIQAGKYAQVLLKKQASAGRSSGEAAQTRKGSVI